MARNAMRKGIKEARSERAEKDLERGGEMAMKEAKERNVGVEKSGVAEIVCAREKRKKKRL